MTQLVLSGMTRASSIPTAASGAGQLPFTAEVLPGRTACEVIADDWRELAQRIAAPSLFQLPELLSVWAGEFATERSFSVVVVRHSGRAVLIWPVNLKRRGPLRIVTGAGAPVGQYDEILLDPGVDGKAAVSAAVRSLVAALRADLILLERVRDDGPLSAAIKDVAAVSGPEGAPYCDLSSGFEALRATLKGRVNSQQKKRVRRFEKEGAIMFEVAANAEQAEAWLGEALALKRDWLRSTGRISRAFADPSTARCLAQLSRNLTGTGPGLRMMVFRLALDGRTAAIEMCFRKGGTLHLYLGAFAPEFAVFGPGNILTERILRWCEENAIGRYDMLAPRSRFKSEWQSGEVEVADYVIPVTVRGRLYDFLVLEGLAPARRRLFSGLPPRMRSVVASWILKI